MKNGVALALSAIWLGLVLVFMPDPAVSLCFPSGMNAEVTQKVDHEGHLLLHVSPKEAASKFSAMTLAGMPVFPREWLVANVASTVPLGESETVDFPRFFDLLPKLFRIGRFSIAALPLVIVMLIMAIGFMIPRAKRRCGRRTFLFALVLTSLLSLPEPIVDSSPGLDSSWSWFLSHFAFKHVFGSEAVFTYGPLGFLLCPQESWGCVLCALVANILFVALWIRLLSYLYGLSVQGKKSAWLLIASAAIPMSMEWRWTLLAVLHTVIPLLAIEAGESDRRLDWAAAGVLAALVALMKFSSLTIVMGGQMFCLWTLAFRFRVKSIRPIAIYAISALMAFIVLSTICFSSLGAWMAWVRGSVATASGYNMFMVAEKPWFELLLPFVIGLAFLAATGWRRFFLFGPILFLTAKYAWVRQSAGPMAYAAAALAAACLVSCKCRWRRAFALGVFALFLNVALALPSALSGLADIQSVSGIKPLAFWHTLLLPRTVGLSRERSERAVASCRLPSEWCRRIGHGRVVFLPVEYGPAMADSSIDVMPLPSLQLYSACHPYLDGLNAAMFEKRMADFVVCEINAVGCGYCINYPRTWGALLENYECVDDNGRFALMALRKEKRERAGRMVAFLSEIPLSEKARAVLFRRPIEYATLERNDGKTVCFQFIRGNQVMAFPLAWIPFDDQDIREILHGRDGKVCTMHFDAQKDVRSGDDAIRQLKGD